MTTFDICDGFTVYHYISSANINRHRCSKSLWIKFSDCFLRACGTGNGGRYFVSLIIHHGAEKDVSTGFEFTPFNATSLFLYHLKIENQRSSDVFRGYRKTPAAWNGFIFSQIRISIYRKGRLLMNISHAQRFWLWLYDYSQIILLYVVIAKFFF